MSVQGIAVLMGAPSPRHASEYRRGFHGDSSGPNSRPRTSLPLQSGPSTHSQPEPKNGQVRERPMKNGKDMIHSRQVSAHTRIRRGWIHVGPSRPWPGWCCFLLVNFVIVVQYKNFEYHRSERAIKRRQEIAMHRSALERTSLFGLRPFWNPERECSQRGRSSLVFRFGSGEVFSRSSGRLLIKRR